MSTVHRFASYIEDKSHRKIIFWFCSGFSVFLLFIFELFSFLPPAVQAANQLSPLSLNQSLTFDFLGSVSEKSLQVKIDPPTPYQISWTHPTLLKSRLTITPTEIFYPNAQYRLSFAVKNWLGFKSNTSLQFKTQKLPKISSVTPADKAVNIKATASFHFELNNSVPGLTYLLHTEPAFEKTSTLAGNTLIISPKTRLKQGQTYQVDLFLLSTMAGAQRLYSGSFQTLDPLVLEELVPANAAKAVSKFSGFSFKFNKPVNQATLNKAWEIDPQTEGSFAWKNEISFDFVPASPLKTSTTYTVGLTAALAANDGSQLAEEQRISFQTAGPIQVSSISPSGGYFPTGSAIKVTFDQPVDHVSAQTNFSISPAVNGSFSWQDNSLVFKPTGLALLTTYQVKIASGIKSIGGEDSVQNFSGGFTTTGERTRVIGYSVQHRPLTAYYFGTGTKKILLVGCLHGLECNTETLLNQWISYLRANQGALGPDRTFIIVPLANPDGKALKQRFNANGVDLNRNWDANWQAQTYWKAGTYPNGGGSAPFSEPETIALRNLINSESPVRIISYHAAANLVVGEGISTSFRNWYSSKTGYGAGSGGDEDFGYSITGTLEDWATNQGIASIVVELATTGSSEYSKNFPALKDLLGVYQL